MKRTLLHATMAVALGALAMNAYAFQSQQVCKKETLSFIKSIPWNAEYDVVVLGYGFAGGAASIAAADNGAKVLLVEKAPLGEEGGNSRYSAQHAMWIDGSKASDADILKYFQTLRGLHDNPSDATFKAFIKEAKNQVEYLRYLGAKNPSTYHYAEYPDFPGSKAISIVVVSKPGGDGKLYGLIQQNVQKRHKDIDVWYSSPAKKLIQDPCSGTIEGVAVKSDGKMRYVFARKGVVLATGGFEDSPAMFRNFAWRNHAYPKGAKFNTGDGIIMAQEVGARLVHLATVNGPDPNVINPANGKSFGYMVAGDHDIAWNGPAFTRFNVIMVGGDGQRFWNETLKTKHGRILQHGNWRSLNMPYPAYMIWDENARKASKVYGSWDQSLQKEIKEGIVVKADSIEALAKLIHIDPKALEETVTNYNAMCKAGKDTQFGRKAEFLKPLITAPFYAAKVEPTYTNTQGGPERNENGQILDNSLKPIPHLYGAGELGSIFSDKYNGSGNIGESLIFGRISGKNVATSKPVLMVKDVLHGKKGYEPKSEQPKFKLMPGEKIAQSRGIGGPIVLAVKMDGSKIVSVRILEEHETKGIGHEALIKLAKEASTSGKIPDAVSGASVSSKGFHEALESVGAK